MATLTIARNDDDVGELTAASVAMLEMIADQYDLNRSVTLFETHHGHIVTFLREEGSYQPRSEGQAARLNAQDASFFLSLRGLRWFRRCTDCIEIGFDNCATVILEKAMCSGSTAFANAVYSLQPLSKLLRYYNQRTDDLICHHEKFENRRFEQVTSDINNT